MTTFTRRELRVSSRAKIFSKHPHGVWLLRRRADEWARQPLRDTFIDLMEDFIETRSWARSWSIVERFHTNSIDRPVPRGPSALVAGLEPGMRPSDEEFLQARLNPILNFRVLRDRDSASLEVSIPFPQVNSQPVLPIIDAVRLSLDALNRTS